VLGGEPSCILTWAHGCGTNKGEAYIRLTETKAEGIPPMLPSLWLYWMPTPEASTYVSAHAEDSIFSYPNSLKSALYSWYTLSATSLV